MAKNITISEGTQAKNFNNVAKIRTNKIGGGNQLWVPEDEAKNYVDFGTLSTNENGTFYAEDEGVDGFSEVIVNVPTVEPILTTKTITENGTYNASDDNAQGYSSVTVNVQGSYGRILGGGINNAPVSARMSTKNFFDALQQEAYRIALEYYTSESDKTWIENKLLTGKWLTDYIPDIYNYNNLVLVGGCGYSVSDYNIGRVRIWFWICGIMDNSATVTIRNIDDRAGDFTIDVYNDNKFTPSNVSDNGVATYIFDRRTGITHYTPWSDASNGVKHAIDNGITGSSSEMGTRNINGDAMSPHMPYSNLITNLTGGTRP